MVDSPRIDKFNDDLNKMIITVGIMKNDLSNLQEDFKELKDLTTEGVDRLREETKSAIQGIEELINEMKKDLDPLYERIDGWKNYTIMGLGAIALTLLASLIDFIYNVSLKGH